MVRAGADDTIKPAPSLHDDPTRVPCLTILCHPDSRRIGDLVRLEALAERGSVELARDALHFVQPGGGRVAVLGDRHLSRRPVVLSARAGTVTIRVPDAQMGVLVDGEPVSEVARATPEAMEAGVVIELAKRVVLLLHRVGEPHPQRPPDLGLVGANEAMDELRRNVLRVADMPVPVLIRGETGTGKELLAQAVHDASNRAKRAFVSVNMAAIPVSTAASELFGHRKGAFTGAVDDHKGYFEKADGGTLFLDEIGATPLDIQPMLLRALEAREIQPLGSGATRRVDARLVAATDANLEQAITNESFRAALLHRLEGYQLFLPPLRERRDDIGRLLIHFLRIELAATGELDRLEPRSTDQAPWLPASLVGRLARLAWPGNVRQLRNVVRQLAISSRGANHVRIDSAVSRLLELAAAPHVEPAATPGADAVQKTGPSEDELIEALRVNDWQPNRAAAQLGISRSTMYERMKQSTRIRQAKDLDDDEILAARDECNGDLAAMAQRLEVSTRALKLRMKDLDP